MRPFLRKSPFASAVVLVVAAARISPAAPDPAAPNWRAMLGKYCIPCHNQRSKTGGLALDRIDLTQVPDQPEIWEKVVRKLHAGAMPPMGLPRPDRTASDGFATWLEAKLDAAATG